MQIMFAMGLEHALEDHDRILQAEAQPSAMQSQSEEEHITTMAPTIRIGLQDDTYFVGSAKTLEENWERLTELLESAGHRLRAYK